MDRIILDASKIDVPLKSIAVFLLSFLVVGGYVWDIYMVLNGKVDTASDPQKSLMVGQALGNLQGMASIILAFYFGTTKGSEDKNTALSAAVDKIPSVPSTQTTISTTTTSPQPKEPLP